MQSSTTAPGESARAPTENLHAYALAAHAAGLCIVPPKQDGSKMPVGKAYVDEEGQERHGWTPWQSERSTPDQLAAWYERDRKTGIGYVCGAVSGGLELFEFEFRETRDAFVAVAEQLDMGDLVARIEAGYRSDTPGGGVHWLMRCTTISGNTKLARRPKRDDEKKHPKDDIQVLIETRGEGGYTVEAPSNGRVHPTGGVYRLVSGSVETIVTITPDERRWLHELAATFDEMPENAPQAAPEPSTGPDVDEEITFGPVRDALRQGAIEDFNARATWHEVLEPHGWVLASPRGTMGYWRRPGKDRAHSATTNFGGSDRLCVFSTATGFKTTDGQGSKAGHDKFGAYAVLNHGGDQKAAYRDLSDRGYGSERRRGDPSKVVGSFVLNGKRHTTYADGRVVITPIEPPTTKEEAAPNAPPPNGVAHDGTEAGTPQPFNRTEMGLAEVLVKLHGQDLRYCFPQASWRAWDGRRYRRDLTGEARRRAKATVRAIYAVAAKTEDDKQRASLVSFGQQMEKAAKVAAILTLAESEPGIPILPEDMDADPFLFNVLNGTVDLRTGQLRPHDRADTLTKLAPVAYDATAECPRFLAFLERVVPDEDVRAFLRRFVGYCLTGDTSEQCLAFLHGGGANGKSTLLGILLELLGEYGKQAAPDLLTHKTGDRHPTELADLFGARLVTSVEVDEGKRLAETLVKQMTGGDKMKARYMRGDFFEWAPTHKLVLAANHRPVIRGTDYAIWRRIHMVSFTVTIPESERDGRLPTKLRAELPGILNWSIRGCLEWQRDGLGVPKAVKDATADYRADQDVLGDFLAEKCIKDGQATVTAADLYKAYTEWCEVGNEKTLNKNAFGRALTERGFEAQKGSKGARIWRGLRLLAPDEEPPGGGFEPGGGMWRDFPYSSSDSPREGDNREEAPNAPPDGNAPPNGGSTAPPCFGCGAVVDTDGLLCSDCLEVTA